MAERPLCATDIAPFLADLRDRPRIALAVSGGPDSMALLVLVREWLDLIGDRRPEITVLTVDHGLRPGSDRESEWVKSEAGKLGFAASIVTWTGVKPDRGVQEAARKARYDLLTETCQCARIPLLLTAHHLDDQAETFVMRLARGSGIDGLAAIPERSVWGGIEVRRPLLDFPKARLIATLEASGRSWIDDPSNADERFERVCVRQALIELEKLGVSAQSLALTAKRMRRAQMFLDQLTDRFLESALVLEEAGYCTLDRRELLAAGDEIALRALGRCLSAISGRRSAPRLTKLENLLEAYKAGDWRDRTLAGCRLTEAGARLLIARELRPPGPPDLVLNPGEDGIWDRRFRVALSRSAPRPVHVRALTEAGYLRVRKCLGSDPALPAAVRAGLVSFWDGNEVVAVPHIAYRSQDRTADPGTAGFCEAEFVAGSRSAGLR
jgi:tRNA(Ile)-lysidine synthase